jgi:hypothetical protein
MNLNLRKNRSLKAITPTLLVYALLLTSCKMVNTPPVVLNTAPALITEKSKAEQWARILKSEHTSEREVFSKGRKLYIDASTEFDGIVGGIKLRVSNNLPIDSDNFRDQVKVGVSKAELFVDYVQSLKSGQTMSPAVVTALVNALVPVLWTNITNTYTLIKEQQSKTRERLLNSLDDLKWQPFESISTSQALESPLNKAQKSK